MQNALREARTLLQESERLLNTSPAGITPNYDFLNETAQEAYIAINRGMHENPLFRSQCIPERDRLRSMLPIMDHLKDTPLSFEKNLKHLQDYRAIGKEILSKIETILSPR